LFENNMPRRIYTDGRGWPDHPEPSELGLTVSLTLQTAADEVIE
jgi:hypothetical protein